MPMGIGLSNSLKTLVAASLAALLVACGGGDPEPDATTKVDVATATATPTANPTVAAGVAGPGSDVLGLALESAGRLEIYDVVAISGSDVPRSLRNEFEDSWEGRLDEVGIDLYDLETLVSSGDDEPFIVSGQIDFETVRGALDDAGYADDEYRGYELWEGRSGAVAMFESDGMAVVGASEMVRDILQAVSRDRGLLSTATDSDLKRALERVGSGYVVVASVGCGWYRDLGGCLANARRLSAAQGAGMSAYEALSFTSERRAQAGVEDVEEQVDVTWDMVEVQAEGEFVTVEATLDPGVSEALARFLGTVSPSSLPAPEIAAVTTPPGLASTPTPLPSTQAAPEPTKAPTPAPEPTATTAPARGECTVTRFSESQSYIGSHGARLYNFDRYLSNFGPTHQAPSPCRPPRPQKQLGLG